MKSKENFRNPVLLLKIFRLKRILRTINIVAGEAFCHEKWLKIQLTGKQLEHLKTKFRGLQQSGSGVSEKMKL
jgi:hypothetical protein